MVISGVPHRLRPHLWLRSTNAAALCAECPLRYDELVACAFYELEGTRQYTEVNATRRAIVEHNRSCHELLQIERDLCRTFPFHIYYDHIDKEGVAR